MGGSVGLGAPRRAYAFPTLSETLSRAQREAQEPHASTCARTCELKSAGPVSTPGCLTFALRATGATERAYVYGTAGATQSVAPG
jgi:hypothetical protein